MSKINKGGIITNLDNKFTDEERRDLEESKNLDDIIEEGWKKPTSGQGAFKAKAMRSEHDSLIVTEDELNDEIGTATNRKVLTTWGYKIDPEAPFGIVCMMSDESVFLVEQGMYCGQCFILQNPNKKDNHCEMHNGVRTCNAKYIADHQLWVRADDPRFPDTPESKIILP